MAKDVTENRSELTINENLSKNIELYNKYTMLLASIFISALTAIGQHNGSFNGWLKTSIFLFSISLSSALLELTCLIFQDSIILKTIQCKLLERISPEAYSTGATYLAFTSLVGFLLGIFAVNIFIFTLKG